MKDESSGVRDDSSPLPAGEGSGVRVEQDDPTLRTLFQKLGNEDRAQAPSFHQVLGRQVPRQVWGPRLRMAAAVVLLGLGLGILINLPGKRPSAAAPSGAGRPAASISEWRAPTDVLLKTPGGELLTTVPSLRLTLGATESRDSTTGRSL